MTTLNLSTGEQGSEQAEASSPDAPTSRTMFLITLEQRAALLEFLARQPYVDVAGGVDFLRQAPLVNVRIQPEGTAPEGDGEGQNG